MFPIRAWSGYVHTKVMIGKWKTNTIDDVDQPRNTSTLNIKSKIMLWRTCAPKNLQTAWQIKTVLENLKISISRPESLAHYQKLAISFSFGWVQSVSYSDKMVIPRNIKTLFVKSNDRYLVLQTFSISSYHIMNYEI